MAQGVIKKSAGEVAPVDTLWYLVGDLGGAGVSGRPDAFVVVSLSEGALAGGACDTGEPMGGAVELAEVKEREEALGGPCAESAVKLVIGAEAGGCGVGVERRECAKP